MTLDSIAIEGGFQNPVFDAQTIFRAVMQAMAEPGTIHKGIALAKPPAPLTPEAAAVALALCDQDTPIWLDPALAGDEAVRAWLAFHTGAPLANTPADAHFILAADPEHLIGLENFAQGSQEYPDRSATLVLQVNDLSGGEELVLDGPGIESEARLAPRPMPRHFTRQWAQNHARFPRGIDLILVSREGLAALPRSTRITSQEA
ncbi:MULTISPECIES: phosphonate C-P lyase system protein PhnH [Nitratireductor]|uniref:phosphonate C-P lyase system protein PhnH n=1 Tax=Nitratireductor TaxID=245876 RepID=UPI0019D3D49B|nr:MULTISPECIES: phosphonate C-P lyase system protein PhnH [Nitratireductor]MBN7761765.1 phosphonate C-P lyase system protein PhnH [Nitratireductor aquibiodomus]MBN7775650.1 phosphonate C-P lyase system protein PhnH [Nitratireductor pacificus]MBN7781885.1 phosphonate C-P lyase system protein PhnH [Nitratireductor pacificus]MBN7790691.1 phosphonate C-P lyase system protein PhnH [Nitratireductor aquimarinus]MBY6098397.1 phosphonate C-P lyase system protein PhnH [Nitratireductor aquimarinus]